MRISKKEWRLKINQDTELKFFSDELAYYRQNNQYPVKLFNKDIVNIYKNINVQVVISRRCNLKCGFCIENDGMMSNIKEVDPSILFRSVIEQYVSQGIRPHVSITGGEPTLFSSRLRNTLNICSEFGINRVNINTNGENLECIEDMNGFMINLSRHHYVTEKAKDIFGKPFKDKMLEGKTVMQCVLMKGYIDTIDEIKSYMDHYAHKGAVGFSFRGLTKLDAGKEYSKEINWSAAHAVNFYEIVDMISKDDDFEFVEQKIGDHYWFEMWKYKGMMFRLTYSNFDWLRKVETEERNNNEWFSRATIVLPTGGVYSGWTYDINKIYQETQ